MKTQVLLFAVGLILGPALSLALGQPQRPEVVASDIPVDDLDRGTLRRAMVGFLHMVHARDYQRAAASLDLRHLPLEMRRFPRNVRSRAHHPTSTEGYR